MRIAAPGTESGALAMMVITYWEQACAFLNYGLLHEDLFFETSGEFYGVWEPRQARRFRNFAKRFVQQAVLRDTWRRPQRALRPGWKAATPAMSRRCGNSCSNWQLRTARQQKRSQQQNRRPSRPAREQPSRPRLASFPGSLVVQLGKSPHHTARLRSDSSLP